jgi:O-antigen/teichoic acid export membrane protein
MIANEPNGYAEMGLFNAANQWRAAIQFLPGMLAMAALPMLSSLREPNDSFRYRKLLRVNLMVSFGAAATTALPIIALSPWIMTAYGRDFASGSSILVVLSVVTVITAALNIVGQAIASQGRMWGGLALNMIWGAVMLAACSLWRHMGAMGLAWATFTAYSVHSITSAVYMARLLSRSQTPHPPQPALTSREPFGQPSRGEAGRSTSD